MSGFVAGAVVDHKEARTKIRTKEEQATAERLSQQIALAGHLVVHDSNGKHHAVKRIAKEAKREGFSVTIDAKAE